MVEDPLSVTFAALADPTRRAILARLANGEATVNELAEPFSMSLQAISKHLKVLERAGLITRGRDAQYRPCRLEAAPLYDAAGWIDDHCKAWAGRFDRMAEHLHELQAGAARTRPTGDAGAARTRRTGDAGAAGVRRTGDVGAARARRTTEKKGS